MIQSQGMVTIQNSKIQWNINVILLHHVQEPYYMKFHDKLILQFCGFQI